MAENTEKGHTGKTLTGHRKEFGFFQRSMGSQKSLRSFKKKSEMIRIVRIFGLHRKKCWSKVDSGKPSMMPFLPIKQSSKRMTEVWRWCEVVQSRTCFEDRVNRTYKWIGFGQGGEAGRKNSRVTGNFQVTDCHTG